MVELMVGTVISLLVTLTVAGSAQFLDVQKRITIGTNGVLETMAISYREISNDIKMAGYGISKCTHVLYKNTVSGVTTVNDLTQPLFITSTTGSDEITSFYGESLTGSAYSFLLEGTTGGSFKTTYAGQLNNGNAGNVTDGSLVVIKQPKDADGISPNCSIYALNSIAIASGEATTTLNATVDGIVWGSDTATTYPMNSMVFGLASVKNINLKVVNNTLQEVNAFKPSITTQIADNIVYFKAYYGIDDGTFVPATGAWEASALTVASTKRIRSIRVFMVARSPVLNKKVNGACTATDNDHKVITSWDEDLSFDVSTLTDGQCYKYMKSDFIVPLRNKVLSDMNV